MHGDPTYGIITCKGNSAFQPKWPNSCYIHLSYITINITDKGECSIKDIWDLCSCSCVAPTPCCNKRQYQKSLVTATTVTVSHHMTWTANKIKTTTLGIMISSQLLCTPGRLNPSRCVVGHLKFMQLNNGFNFLAEINTVYLCFSWNSSNKLTVFFFFH